jgi:hypothetical protein
MSAKFIVIALMPIIRNGDNALQILAKDYLKILHKLMKRGLGKEEKVEVNGGKPHPQNSAYSRLSSS